MPVEQVGVHGGPPLASFLSVDTWQKVGAPIHRAARGCHLGSHLFTANGVPGLRRPPGVLLILKELE